MNNRIDPYTALVMLTTVGLIGGIGIALLVGTHS